MKDLDRMEASHAGVTEDPWTQLSRFTDARIALGRVGSSMPTHEVLKFTYAHANARDAVQTPLDFEKLSRDLAAIGLASVQLDSRARDRQIYLKRPDLGRMLADEADAALQALASDEPIVLVVADGLSSTAVQENAPPFMAFLLERLKTANLAASQVALVRNGRVAIGDEIGARLDGQIVVVMIGERPGLSAADSLGVYITYDPKPGRTDAERNCISNVRLGGLSPAEAARKASWIITEALKRKLTGVALKDESDSFKKLDVAPE